MKSAVKCSIRPIRLLRVDGGGFTLIELLVVIAIVGILASLPAFRLYVDSGTMTMNHIQNTGHEKALRWT